MAFRVQFTGDYEWPIQYNDGIVPVTLKAKGFRIINSNMWTNFIFANIEVEAGNQNAFWVDASTAIKDNNGIVHFK